MSGTPWNLPACSQHYPSCGACGGETSHDGDTFYCPDCELDYGDGEDGTKATFRDEDVTPCGAPCINYWHRPGLIEPGWAYACAPCALPVTHESDHWHNCQPVRRADR